MFSIVQIRGFSLMESLRVVSRLDSLFPPHIWKIIRFSPCHGCACPRLRHQNIFWFISPLNTRSQPTGCEIGVDNSQKIVMDVEIAYGDNLVKKIFLLSFFLHNNWFGLWISKKKILFKRFFFFCQTAKQLKYFRQKLHQSWIIHMWMSVGMWVDVRVGGCTSACLMDASIQKL